MTAFSRVVFNPGVTGELVVTPGHASVKPIAMRVSLRPGTLAPLADVRTLHYGKSWSSVEFADAVNVYLEGQLVFTGHVTNPIESVRGTSVIQRVEATGRRRILYSESVSADKTYLATDTGAIAKDVIDLETFSPALTTTGVDTTSGVVPASFEVKKNENVGSVLERLAQLDDHVVDVDASNVVTRQALSTTPQLTVYEEDLIGEADERERERGASPPVNAVRVLGGDGYAARTLQETRDAWHTLDAPAKYVAQRVKASKALLSALQLHLNRSIAPNQPASLGIELRTDTTQQHTFDDYGTPSAAGTKALSTTSWVAQTFVTPNETTAPLTLTAASIRRSLGAGSMTIEVRTVDGSNKPTSTILGTASAGTGDSATLSIAVSPNTKYCIVAYLASGGPDNAREATAPVGGREGWHSTDSGASWVASGMTNDDYAHTLTYHIPGPSGTKVEWSDDHTISPNDLPYPSTEPWSAEKSWTAPKLALTLDAYYWLILKASSDATASKYWQVGLKTASSGYADGFAMSTTNSGTTWSPLAHDLTFRLFWSAAQVDVLVEDAASIAANGRWPIEVTLSDVVDEATATQVGQIILNKRASPGKRMRLPLDRLVPGLNLTQPIRVIRPLLDVNEDLEVVEIIHEVHPDGAARTTLIVGTAEYNPAHALEELRKVT